MSVKLFNFNLNLNNTYGKVSISPLNKNLNYQSCFYDVMEFSIEKVIFFLILFFAKMVETQRQVTHYEMPRQQWLCSWKNDLFVLATTYLFLESVRLELLLFGDSFPQISLENFA